MKFTSTILFFSVAYLASLASGTPIVSILSPSDQSHHKAGSDLYISWKDPIVQTISQIVLAKGTDYALQTKSVIAKNVKSQDLRYVWKIPIEIENGFDYYVSLGTFPDDVFAGPLNITGGVGGNK